MLVQFQNLLEENTTDICYGILNDDQTVSCLCGCDGIFEPQDYKIIHIYPNADIGSIIQIYQNREETITLRNSFYADFSDVQASDDNFQYMKDQLDMQYRNQR